MKRYIFDIETNPIDFSNGTGIANAHTVHCIILYDVDANRLHKFYDTDELRELGSARLHVGIKELENADEIIGHNIIEFDIPVLRKLYGFKPTGRVTDTLVTSRTLYPDRDGGHSLREWGSRLGYPKGDFTDFEKLSPEMLEYCERDVRLNFEIWKRLCKNIEPGWEGALELEHEIARIIAAQERYGFKFDTEKAERYVQEWGEEIDGIDCYIHSNCTSFVRPGPVISKPFKINGQLSVRSNRIVDNYSVAPEYICGPCCFFDYVPPDLNSKIQQKKLLLSLGWKPKSTTKTGEPKLCDSIKDVGPIGEALAKRNVLSHRRSQVIGLIEMAREDGRVHGGAITCGTNTARMRHKRIVNIPKVVSAFGLELRSSFTVPDDKVLVGYDAKALELRMLAHYIKNEDYNERVTTTDKSRDAHVLAASAAGNDSRDLGKTINYALIYGAGDGRLGSIIGGSAEDGELLRRKLYDAIPGFESLCSRVKRYSQRGYVPGIDGRKLYVRNRVSPLNTLVQGGGAIFMKTVAVELDRLVEQQKLDAVKVVDMHDEAQWECDPKDVDALSNCINTAFERATALLELTCPQEADIKVGKNWAETH